MSREMNGVIFKFSFNHPDFKLNNVKMSDNKAHLNYIANRPGVDKSISEKDLNKYFEDELERGVGDSEYLNYLKDISTEDTYLNYIDKRIGSAGLFGADGIQDIKDIENQMDKAQNFIYRGIVSLREEDSIRLGYSEKEKWEDMFRKTSGQIAKEMGISRSNLKWVAAFHQKEGNPHIHFMMWETNKIEKISPYLSKPQLRNIKKILNDEIFEDERLNVLLEKNATRDLIREIAKDDISQIVRINKDIEKAEIEVKDLLGDNFKKSKDLGIEDIKFLSNKIKELSNNLPEKGRLNYAFMPENIKIEIDEITDFLLKKPDLQKSMNLNMQSVEKLTRYYSGKQEDIDKAQQNALNDIKKRVGNIILKGTNALKYDNYMTVDIGKSNRVIDFIKKMDNKIDNSEENKEYLEKLLLKLKSMSISYDLINEKLKEHIKLENLNINENDLNNILFKVNTMASNSLLRDVYGQANTNLSTKETKNNLSILKVLNFNENESYSILKNLSNSNIENLESQLKSLENQGYLVNKNNNYSLTDTGKEEFLKHKKLNGLERAIIKNLKVEKESCISLDELLKDKDIICKLKDYKINDFKFNKNDSNIRTFFGLNNSITLEELEKKIIDNNTNKEKIFDFNQAEKDVNIATRRIEALTKNNCVDFNKETKSYSFNEKSDALFYYDDKKDKFLFTEQAMNELKIDYKEYDFGRYDIENTLKYIEKADGCLSKNFLKEEIIKENQNDTEKGIQQYNYIIKRLESLERQGYVAEKDNQFRITDKGLEEKDKFVNPQKYELKDELNYLRKLGLIKFSNDTFKLSDKYDKYIENSVKKITSNEQSKLSKEFVEVLDFNKNNINLEKLKINNNRNIVSSFIKDEFKDIENINLKNILKIENTTEKILKNLSKILLTADVSIDEVKNILNDWNIKTDSGLNKENIDKIVENVNFNIQENKLFNMPNIVSKSEWEETFKILNIKEKNIPEWIYKSNHSPSFINDLWKGIFNSIEKKRIQSEAQARNMFKKLTKEESLKNNKAARKEQLKKGSYELEDE